MVFKKIYTFVIKVFAYTKRKLEKSKHLWPQDRLSKGLMKSYKSVMGYEFDINNPVLFTEKLQWYKLFYRKENLERVVDKYLFKGYIKEKLGDGYTVPMYGAYSSISELEKAWDSLPEEFCLKSTLQSDGNFIKIIHNKSKTDFNRLKKELGKWLKVKNTLINSYCSAYHNATPRILAEEYIPALGQERLYDWKFFCFDGQVHNIYVSTGNFGDAFHHISFYDTDWNMLEVKYGEHKPAIIEKPKFFAEMLEISEKLSKDFPFVRVDFFETDERLYVAELTLYPGGGFVALEPESFNKEMGDKFILRKN